MFVVLNESGKAYTARSSISNPSFVEVKQGSRFQTREHAQVIKNALGPFCLFELEIEEVDPDEETVQSTDSDVNLSDDDDMTADTQHESVEQYTVQDLKLAGLFKRYYGSDVDEDGNIKDSVEVEVKESKVLMSQIPPSSVLKFDSVANRTPDPEAATIDTHKNKDGIDHDLDKVKVPAKVKSEIKSAIKKHVDLVKRYGKSNYDTTATSFCLTLIDSLEQLLVDLDQGTVEGLKFAQLKLNSFMSPIQNEIPQVVKDYIMSAGQEKRSLNDLFRAVKEGVDVAPVNEVEQLVYNVRIVGQIGKELELSDDVGVTVAGSTIEGARVGYAPDTGIITVSGHLRTRRRDLSGSELRKAGVKVGPHTVRITSADVGNGRSVND